MIRVVCGCGRVFKAEDRHAGKRTKCPVCGTTLTIGGPSVSSSSGEDFDEVPSWWYPSDPQEPAGPDSTPLEGGGDLDSIQTAVFPPGSDSSLTSVIGNHSRLSIPSDDARLRASTRSSSRVGRLWALSVGTAVLAVLALGAIISVWPGIPHDGRMPKGAVAPPGQSRDRVASPTTLATAGAAPSKATSGGSRESSPVASDIQPPEEIAAGGLPAHLARRLRLLVPAYIYPNKDGRKEWNRLMAVASKVDIVAVANPDSGPGSASNADYSAIIADAAGHGVKLVGYVNTQYAKRALAEVEKDIDTWVDFYPQIAGFFLDQQSCDAQSATYYAELRTYVRGKLRDPLVITNPGSPCDRAFFTRR
ncbi:MAG: spherulation-specific family 4 protein, partial [Isosphaeraceae bacterium]